jgi:hypothetical protein
MESGQLAHDEHEALAEIARGERRPKIPAVTVAGLFLQGLIFIVGGNFDLTPKGRKAANVGASAHAFAQRPIIPAMHARERVYAAQPEG